MVPRLKGMKHLLALVAVLLLFSACSKEDSSDMADAKASRAVMIYMAGENNLTVNDGKRYLHLDLEEIVEGSKYLTDDQRLFVFVDSLGTFKLNRGTPYIIEVHGSQIYNRKEFRDQVYQQAVPYYRMSMMWMTV